MQTKVLSILTGTMLVVALMLSSCASSPKPYSANTGLVKSPQTRSLSDEIVWVGQSTSAPGDNRKGNNEPIFFGSKYAYLFKSGGSELIQITQSDLDGRFFKSYTAKGRELFVNLNQFWGDILLTYEPPEAISNDEKSKLKSLGFVQLNATDNKYVKIFKTNGEIYPIEKYSSEQKSSLHIPVILNMYYSKDGPTAAPLVAPSEPNSIILSEARLNIPPNTSNPSSNRTNSILRGFGITIGFILTAVVGIVLGVVMAA